MNSNPIPNRVGRYEVLKLLARGIWGPLYVARDPLRDRQVAVKVLEIDDAELSRRAIDAARAAARLKHPCIITIYEVSEEQGQPFIAMEYVDGECLADVIGRQAQLSMARRIELIQNLCDALAYAHRMGVVHTDIQPEHLLITRDGELKIPLLGPARLTARPTPHSTHAGMMIGTPQYMSPERIHGRELDHRTDVFSVGVVLYELLTYSRAFDGALPSLLLKILNEQPRPASQLNPNVDRDLEGVIAKALQKTPSDRYVTMSDFAKDLAHIRSRIASKESAVETSLLVTPTDATPIRRHVDLQTRRRIDENVQFSVYRPAVMTPARWYSMVVFAHLAARRPDATPDEPDPLEEVARRAKAVLGHTASAPTTRIDALSAIPEEGQLRVVPRAPGLSFDPPEHRFLWLHTIHQVEFNLRADADFEGRTARGSIDIYLGALAVAHIPLSIPIEARADRREPPVAKTVNTYRRLFASYSHKDEAIVRQFESYAKGLGDRYVRDVIDLRAGERWSTRLCELIESADVFQLFWSQNSMESAFVRQEWEHALTVQKPDFIRPVYWELPFPKRRGLPPSSLAELQFAFVGSVGVAPEVAMSISAEANVALERAMARDETERRAREEVERREHQRKAQAQRLEAQRAEAEARAFEAERRAREEHERRGATRWWLMPPRDSPFPGRGTILRRSTFPRRSTLPRLACGRGGCR